MGRSFIAQKYAAHTGAANCGIRLSSCVSKNVVSACSRSVLQMDFRTAFQQMMSLAAATASG